jgi:hypothetical protein
MDEVDGDRLGSLALRMAAVLVRLDEPVTVLTAMLCDILAAQTNGKIKKLDQKSKWQKKPNQNQPRTRENSEN